MSKPIVRSFAPLAILLSAPALAGPWDADLRESSFDASTHVDLVWDVSDFGACATGPLPIYDLMVRYRPEVSGIPLIPPQNPTAGDLLERVADTVDSATHDTLRSKTRYTYSIFACYNEACDLWCGDSLTEDTTTTGRTEPEKWVVSGVGGYTSDTGVEIAPEETYAPHAMQFVDGSYADQLGVYFYGKVDGQIGAWLTRTNDLTAWEDNLNDDSTWSAGEWSEPTLIMTETNDGAGSMHTTAVNPWFVTLDDGTVRMFWVNAEYGGDYGISYSDSVNTNGDDWDYCCEDAADCTTSGCGYSATDTVCCDFDDNTPVETSVLAGESGGLCLATGDGLHGRLGWDYVSSDGWDPTAATDAPTLFPSHFDNTLTGCSSHSTHSGPDDIFQVTWDETSGDLDTATVASGAVLSAAHSPSFVPWASGEYKIYTNEADTSATGVRVMFTTDDGVTFEDESAAELYFDNGLGAPDAAAGAIYANCILDPHVLAWQDNSSEVQEHIMLFVANHIPDGGTPVDCFQDVALGQTYGRILSAVLYNP